MRYTSLNYVVVALYTLSLILLSYSLNIISTIQGLLLTMALAVAVSGLGSYLALKDLRYPTVITYVTYVVTFLYGYSSMDVRFTAREGPYFIIASSLTSLPSLLATLLMRGDSALAHLPIVISLPIAFTDTYGLIALAVVAIYVILCKSLRDAALATLAFISIYTPYSILPIIVSNISSIPHISYCGIIYWQPGYEFNLLTSVIASGVIFMAFSSIGVLLRKYLPRVTDLSKLIIYASAVSIPPIVSAITTLALVSKLVVLEVDVLYAYSSYTGMALLLPAIASGTILGFNELSKELNAVRRQIIKSCDDICRGLQNCKEVIEYIALDPILGLKVSRLHGECLNLMKDVEAVRKSVMRFTFSVERLITLKEALNEFRGKVSAIANAVLSEYRAVVGVIKSAYTELALVRGVRDAGIEDMIASLDSINDVTGIPKVADNLRTVATLICRDYVQLVTSYVINIKDVLGEEVGIESLAPCSEYGILPNIISKYRDLIKILSESYGSKLREVYERLITLRNNFAELIKYSNNLIGYETSVTQELSIINETLRRVSEVPPQPYVAASIIRSTCISLRNGLTSLIKVIDDAINAKYAAVYDLIKYLNIDIDASLILPKSDFRVVINELRKLATSSLTFDELISLMLKEGLNDLRALIDYLNELNNAVRRVKYLPLLIKYMDDILAVKDVRVSAIPLPPAVREWFINIYKLTKRDVVINGDVIKKVKR